MVECLHWAAIERATRCELIGQLFGWRLSFSRRDRR